MSRLDLATWKSIAEDRLERYSNKAERTAFLMGLSLGARETNNIERQRVCSDLMSLWSIEEPKKPSLGGGRRGKVERADIGQMDNDLAAGLAAFLGGE